MNEINGKFTRDSMRIFLARVGTLCLSLVIAVILARSLGPAGRGEFALAFLLPSMILLLVEFGIESGAVYFSGKSDIPKEVLLPGFLLISACAIVVGMGVGSLVIVLCGTLAFPDVPSTVLWLSLGIIPGRILMGLSQGVLLGEGKSIPYCTLVVGQPLTWGILICLMLFFFNASVAVVMLACVMSFSVAAAAGLGMVILRQGCFRACFCPRKEVLRKILSFGLRVHPASIMGFLNHRLDVLLLGLLNGNMAVGFYAVAVSVIEKLWLFSRSVSSALYASLAQETDETKRNATTSHAARFVLLITMIPGGVVAAISTLVVRTLFGSSFVPAAGALQALMPGVVMLSVARVLAIDCTARGRPGLNSLTGGIGLAVNILLNLWWIPKFSIVGAAWASTVSYGVIFCLRVNLFIHFSKENTIRFLVPQKVDLQTLLNSPMQFVSGWRKRNQKAGGRA